MNEQAYLTSIDKTSIHDWVDLETRHIDVVASWENLCSTYDALRFSDPLSDVERLEEYKWITHNMNKFLTKIKNKLLTCINEEAMIEVLQRSLTPTGKVELGTRQALAYQKLRQQWIMSAITKLNLMEQQTERID